MTASKKLNNRGFAMLMVLLLIVIASVVGGSYLYATSIRSAISQNIIDSTRAGYLAESGIGHGITAIISGSAFGSESSPVGPYYADSTEDYYRYFIDSLGGGYYRITGLGYVGQITQKSIVTVSSDSGFEDVMGGISPDYWWRMDDQSGYNMVDRMGRKNGYYLNGVSLGNTGAIQGGDNYCADFDGINDYAYMPSLSVGSYKKNFTIGAWVYLDDWGYPDGVIAMGYYSGNVNWSLGTASNKRLQFSIKTNIGEYTVYSPNNTADSGKWMFICANYDGKNINIYLDGELAASDSAKGNVKSHKDEYTYLGIGINGSGQLRYWDGKIDEVFICDYNLTLEQLRAIYAAREIEIRIENWEK